ncbi:hypothetical protein HDU97_001654 [Phlyctochytrium planicorne]|nr:hypothetical protein HDU97_001654 [Phlyctochytrium planicorne]
MAYYGNSNNNGGYYGNSNDYDYGHQQQQQQNPYYNGSYGNDGYGDRGGYDSYGNVPPPQSSYQPSRYTEQPQSDYYNQTPPPPHHDDYYASDPYNTAPTQMPPPPAEDDAGSTRRPPQYDSASALGKSKMYDDDDRNSIKKGRPNFEDNVFANIKGEDDSRKKLRGCLPRSMNGRLICLGVTLAILAAFGVLGFFYWPRFPQISVLEIKGNELDVSAFEFFVPKEANGNLNRMQIKMNLKMNISCYNDNLYHLKIESLDLNANLDANMTAIKSSKNPHALGLEKFIGPAPTGRDPNYVVPTSRSIGSGNKTTLIFPAKQNATFQMDFGITYTPDPQVGLLDDPLFAELLGVCGMTGRARPAHISYTATTQVNFLKVFGFRPSISSSIKILCPIDSGTLENLISYPQTHPDATVDQIIKEVFGTDLQKSG